MSLESSSVCVVDGTGRIIREAKVASEPEALVAWFGGLDLDLTRIGLEAGPLSQWLYKGLKEAGFAVELLETRHVRTAFKTMPVKTDRKDARGIAQLLRMGLVPSRALQVAGGSGAAGGADCAQADPEQIERRGTEPAGHPAWLRSEGWCHDAAEKSSLTTIPAR